MGSITESVLAGMKFKALRQELRRNALELEEYKQTAGFRQSQREIALATAFANRDLVKTQNEIAQATKQAAIEEANLAPEKSRVGIAATKSSILYQDALTTQAGATTKSIEANTRGQELANTKSAIELAQGAGSSLGYTSYTDNDIDSLTKTSMQAMNVPEADNPNSANFKFYRAQVLGHVNALVQGLEMTKEAKQDVSVQRFWQNAQAFSNMASNFADPQQGLNAMDSMIKKDDPLRGDFELFKAFTSGTSLRPRASELEDKVTYAPDERAALETRGKALADMESNIAMLQAKGAEISTDEKRTLQNLQRQYELMTQKPFSKPQGSTRPTSQAPKTLTSNTARAIATFIPSLRVLNDQELDSIVANPDGFLNALRQRFPDKFNELDPETLSKYVRQFKSERRK